MLPLEIYLSIFNHLDHQTSLAFMILCRKISSYLILYSKEAKGYSDLLINQNKKLKRSYLYSHLGLFRGIKFAVENNKFDKKSINDALGWSAMHGYLDTVKYLVENGADIRADYDHAMRISAKNGHLEVVKYLVEKGCDISALSNSALLSSAENGHLEVVKYLADSDVNTNSYCCRAFLVSAENGRLEVVKYLVGKGADINVYGGYMLLEKCLKKGHREVVEYLASLMK